MFDNTILPAHRSDDLVPVRGDFYYHLDLVLPDAVVFRYVRFVWVLVCVMEVGGELSLNISRIAAQCILFFPVVVAAA